MFLIMSGAYVGIELESEFGKIPPSFLPLGNRRLFQHQVALAPEGVDIFISLPDSFKVSDIDRQWLHNRGVKILPVPEQMSIGASLVAALNISGCDLDSGLQVLYGDTLYSDLPREKDVVSISDAKNSYNWAILTSDNSNWLSHSDPNSLCNSNKIVDGYFNFSKPRELIKNITQSKWDFIKGLNLYHQSNGLSAIESIGWLDFGHVNTYYRSKAEYTTQRAFNELKINSKWIEKSSMKNDKIKAEANWFKTIPDEIKGYTPQFLGSKNVLDKISYRLEYLHLTALNELFVFSKLGSNIWTQILESCLDFLEVCDNYDSVKNECGNNLKNLFSNKTNQRLQEYCLINDIGMETLWSFNGNKPTSLKTILEDSLEFLPKGSERNTVLHGDFCFSNILYDFRAGKIKTIDPRGISPDGIETIYGDIRYDLAKLSHSILGLYDWIIAGYYSVEINDNDILLDIAEREEHKITQKIFIEMVEKRFGLSAKTLYAMQIQLFLSMLPLHDDDYNRQKALFANAFRLHNIMVEL
ncbi:capsular biosynthesis protein [Vibrio parahaemolyticus]|uniref:Capsular polysaccharide biosynthesis protein n=1 Tax=Vibrio parahaemolyticus TaxID=670 RepID=A0A5P4S6F9_VIBPH|nr:capsular biosynthesis protein [Vibrio parahaemolyticus]EGR0769661.1 capsular biosynthesis protein [Vibrio parahaemolyticus]EGR0839420.1 capsular biosynthesis protein [Vibrio parahaemolyticus]QFC18076.1 capsular polysaccharide biosynthesis protein [Vibrio parahaemolyticus]TOO67970.1 capsular biosynthesis protein [Vibrio parahaemolyticus]